MRPDEPFGHHDQGKSFTEDVRGSTLEDSLSRANKSFPKTLLDAPFIPLKDLLFPSELSVFAQLDTDELEESIA